MMTNLDKEKKNSDKQYFIPMEVTKETIDAFDINREDVVWQKIGNKPVRVVMIPATKEQYYEYMRPLWREDKKEQRQHEKRMNGEGDISLDSLYDNNEFEFADSYDIEEDLMKRELLETLRKELSALEEIDRKIIKLFGEGYSESAIGSEIGMSQKGVNKRKKKIFLKLKDKLIPYK
ncbi:TPA: sigma-70 family RNA polymerase sigma factor [Streptococcus agalactiae]|nr:sigma-70 family RNA polymerase sigma factor [Streptococcus agalactiae]HER9786902.1 sigma-70 family RNA polymerase sigma factor [Streptococcus pyogenes]